MSLLPDCLSASWEICYLTRLTMTSHSDPNLTPSNFTSVQSVHTKKGIVIHRRQKPLADDRSCGVVGWRVVRTGGGGWVHLESSAASHTSNFWKQCRSSGYLVSQCDSAKTTATWAFWFCSATTTQIPTNGNIWNYLWRRPIRWGEVHGGIFLPSSSEYFCSLIVNLMRLWPLR